MLTAAQRLRRRSEFAAAVRAGRRVGRGAVVVHLDVPDRTRRESPGPQRESPGIDQESLEPVPAGAEHLPGRAGFVVSKAVGNAVVRNKVRRRLRHLVRERLGALPPGATLVVRALPGAADLPYPRLAADLDAALSAARAARKPSRRSR